jgi:hypothetical protein
MTKMRSRAVSLEVYLSAFLGETEASKKDTVLWLFRAATRSIGVIEPTMVDSKKLSRLLRQFC